MNTVHEPGPNGDSETIPSRKTRSKTKPGARAPKLAQLGTPRCTQACPGARAHAVSWPAQRRIVAGLHSRIAASRCRVAVPQRRIADTVLLTPARCAARAMPAPLGALLRASQRIASCKRSYRGRVRAVSWALLRAVSQDTPAACAPILLCHDTIGDCIVTQVSNPTARFCHNTLTCIATQSPHQPLPSLPLGHDTASVL